MDAITTELSNLIVPLIVAVTVAALKIGKDKLGSKVPSFLYPVVAFGLARGGSALCDAIRLRVPATRSTGRPRPSRPSPSWRWPASCRRCPRPRSPSSTSWWRRSRTSSPPSRNRCLVLASV